MILLTPDQQRYEVHISVREWNTLTDTAVRPIINATRPTIRAAHEWLCEYARINKVPPPPPPAWLVAELDEHYDEDLEVYEIGIDVPVPGLPTHHVHKIAVLLIALC